jgi:hypothetical protein
MLEAEQEEKGRRAKEKESRFRYGKSGINSLYPRHCAAHGRDRRFTAIDRIQKQTINIEKVPGPQDIHIYIHHGSIRY